MGDIVYYIKDGHEDFIKSNDWLFFSGKHKSLNKNKVYPWENCDGLDLDEVKCKID